jgi:hypothetical protein
MKTTTNTTWGIISEGVSRDMAPFLLDRDKVLYDNIVALGPEGNKVLPSFVLF